MGKTVAREAVVATEAMVEGLMAPAEVEMERAAKATVVVEKETVGEEMAVGEVERVEGMTVTAVTAGAEMEAWVEGAGSEADMTRTQ